MSTCICICASLHARLAHVCAWCMHGSSLSLMFGLSLFYGGRIPNESAHDQLLLQATGTPLPRRACDDSDPTTYQQQPHRLSGQTHSKGEGGRRLIPTRDLSQTACPPWSASPAGPRPSPAPAWPPPSATPTPSRTPRPLGKLVEHHELQVLQLHLDAKLGIEVVEVAVREGVRLLIFEAGYPPGP